MAGPRADYSEFADEDFETETIEPDPPPGAQPNGHAPGGDREEKGSEESKEESAEDARAPDDDPGEDPPPRKKLKARHPLVERRPITERPWIVEKLAMRGELTVLIAPPAAGKTTLMQQIANALCAGVSWGGWHVPRPLKVLVLHWEDDEDEIDRKIIAAEQAMGFSPGDPENLTTVYCGAGEPDGDDTASIEAGGDDDDLIVAHYDIRAERLTPSTGFIDILTLIREHGPDVVIVDPLANTFSGPEGNELLKAMARLWRRVARRCRCAVVLIHQTKKYADGSMAGNMDAGRNAGTLVGRIRVGLTMFPMTEEEAGMHGVDLARRQRFVRLDDGKQSYAGRGDGLWFEIEEVFLPLAGSEDRSIVVATFKPWTPAELFRGITVATIHAILRDIDKGVIGQDGEPTGELYQPGQNSANWAGSVIIKHVPDCTPLRAKTILAAWKREGLLVEKAFESRQRKERKGLVSNPAKWPGATP